MATDAIRLHGCTATPLAGYLKALGVLRLISSPANHARGVAADAHARGWWENGHFHLATSLGSDTLIRFFLDDYAPSAIIAPWNGGSGFYPKDNREGIGPLTAAVAARFRVIAEGIAVAADEVRRRGWDARPEGDAKASLIATLRGRMADSALHWLDATVALSGGRLSFPQLLGTGGNDGRLDFTNNFMRRLVAARDGLFDAATGAPAPASERLLRAALDASAAQGLRSYSAGQFAPGAAGGANATVGYDGSPHANPWDFVLALEGAVLFAGAATRRHQGAPEIGASFPFTVRATAAGWGGIAEADRDSVRAEFWAPLWRRPAGCDELEGLLKEGRAILRGKTARDGLDFSRAAASLGTSRGITAFQRYGFAMRQGNMYLATPLGLRGVTSHSPETAELINDFDSGGWLQRVRRLAQDQNAPGRARLLQKRFQDSLFGLTDRHANPTTIQDTLEVVGELVAWLATTPGARETVPPPPLLRSAWLERADDGSPEYRTAAALASIGWRPRPRAITGAAASPAPPGGAFAASGTGPASAAPSTAATTQQALLPMASHVAPVDRATVPRRFRAWEVGASHSHAVWTSGALVSNLLAIMERRLISAPVARPLAAAAPTHTEVVTTFLADDFDDRRCARLLAGMVWVRPVLLRRPELTPSLPRPPFAYAALKLLFNPGQLPDTLAAHDARGEDRPIPLPPGLLARLRAGNVDEAVRSALARARASGIASPFGEAIAGGGTDFGVGIAGDRLAAALLIPIHDYALRTLLERAYPSEKENEDVT